MSAAATSFPSYSSYEAGITSVVAVKVVLMEAYFPLASEIVKVCVPGVRSATFTPSSVASAFTPSTAYSLEKSAGRSPANSTLTAVSVVFTFTAVAATPVVTGT